ncbi:RICIN domain-containing protein [Streptomyces sp. NPDC126497]|uniref:RICIN domain-containing protein n=1 Tax=Streptomyces sp. NPDC126497 TaxID=3155313 RepID=UPI0033166D88
MAVTISGFQGEGDRQPDVAGELYQSDAAEPGIPDAKRSLSASASATAVSRPPSTGSPTPSGQETEPGTDKATENGAEPTVSKAPDKDGTGQAGGSAPDPGRALAVEASGNCLTGAGPGSELVVAACTGAASQSWSIGSGTALQQGDLCATVTGTADRTPVVLGPCDQSAAQRFSLSGKSLLSASSGKCLDLFGGASGTQVVLWECNGRDNQRWSST